MMISHKELGICEKGHKYYKTEERPFCPFCEMVRKAESAFLELIVTPARRALESKGVRTLMDLAAFTEEELLALHGFGPASLPKLRQQLALNGLTFRE